MGKGVNLYCHFESNLPSFAGDNTSKGEIENNNQLKVYPNPANDYTTVEINITESPFGQLIIYNMLGEKLVEKQVDKSHIFTIETNNYSDGIYMVVLVSEKGILDKQKLIISK